MNTSILVNRIPALLLILLLLPAGVIRAQKRILIDVSHGQKFWNDPADMTGKDPKFIERVKYMTNEITKTAASTDAGIGYIKSKLTAEQLKGCDLLFIHIPSTPYEADEVAAITGYVKNGGSLFLAVEVDFWATLEQSNVNAIVAPFGIVYGQNSPDTLSGGYTKPGLIAEKKWNVTYHGARQLTGGTPFCFNNQSSEPFGTYVKLPDKGGKIIALGDGMASLYMTSWKDVNDYQCQEFMHDVFAWLLE